RTSSYAAENGPLYYNYDDPLLENATAQGFACVDTQGPIRREDVAAAIKVARRFLVDCQKTILYIKEAGFVVDDKDSVRDPVGIYGRKLEVTVRALLARTSRLENYAKVFQRVFVRRAVPILSILSSARAVKPVLDTDKTLLWDLGRDYLNAAVVQADEPLDARVWVSPGAMTRDELVEKVRQESDRLMASHAGVDGCVLTGDWTSEAGLTDALSKSLGLNVRIAAPSGYPQLENPCYASLVGLLLEAEGLDRKDPRSGSRRDTVLTFKQKAAALVSEYF
ncbi:MAG: hypothetical protein WCG06_07015, partial [Candidatus Omnitrophota bacterium]